MSFDIFDTGKPKYKLPTDIYEAVRAMASGEEIGILSEMFSDVSWENQDYYYVEIGGKLEDRWENTTDSGDKMWKTDVAAWQMDGGDANDWMYQILCNDDLAKRIGFKKLFVDNCCSNSTYKRAAEAFADELRELDYYDFSQNSAALKRALESCGASVYYNPYGKLCSAVYNKLKGLRLEDERQLIAESRAMLTAYDDFMFGLKSNQYLYNQQEKQYTRKVAQLKSGYQAALQQIMMLADRHGIAGELAAELKMLGGGSE